MYFIQQSAQRPLAFILCLVNGSANFDPWVVPRQHEQSDAHGDPEQEPPKRGLGIIPATRHRKHKAACRLQILLD